MYAFFYSCRHIVLFLCDFNSFFFPRLVRSSILYIYLYTLKHCIASFKKKKLTSIQSNTNFHCTINILVVVSSWKLQWLSFYSIAKLAQNTAFVLFIFLFLYTIFFIFCFGKVKQAMDTWRIYLREKLFFHF